MKPGRFEYRRAGTVSDAVEMLADEGVDAKVLAGGQSLVPMLNLRMIATDRIVDVRSIPEMRASFDLGAEVRLGACVTHEEIQSGRVPDPSNGLMRKIASRIAYQAVRNRGTIGGSLALADPAADWVTTMAALAATIEWRGPRGQQSCLAEHFMLAPYTTRLQSADVLTSIKITKLDPDARWGAYKLCRKPGEFAHAMAIVIRSGNRTRAFLGAADGAPIRLPTVEQDLSRLNDWSEAARQHLEQAADADLAASERKLDPIKSRQLRACLTRSTMMSWGIAVKQPELPAW